MSCCNNDYLSKNESILIVNKAREAAACAEANCASSFTNATNAATSATNAAASAAAAAESAEAARFYLGSFAVAPTTDNEGGPLEEGMLYYNTVSNGLFVWNGTVWASADFNEFTNFTATGTTTARNLVTRMTDIVNVKDFGVDGIGDETTKIQNAFNAAQNKTIIFDGSKTYNYTQLTIQPNTNVITHGCTFNRLSASTSHGIIINRDVKIDSLKITTPGGSSGDKAVLIKGGNIDINTASIIAAAQGVYNSSNWAIELESVPAGNKISNVKINNLYCKYFSTALFAKNADLLDVQNCLVEYYRTAFYLKDIAKSQFVNITTKYLGNAVDGRPGENGLLIESSLLKNSSSDLLFENWYVSDSGEHGYRLGGQLSISNVSFINCISEKPGSSILTGNLTSGEWHGGCGFKILGGNSTITEFHENIYFENCGVIDTNIQYGTYPTGHGVNNFTPWLIVMAKNVRLSNCWTKAVNQAYCARNGILFTAVDGLYLDANSFRDINLVAIKPYIETPVPGFPGSDLPINNILITGGFYEVVTLTPTNGIPFYMQDSTTQSNNNWIVNGAIFKGGAIALRIESVGVGGSYSNLKFNFTYIDTIEDNSTYTTPIIAGGGAATAFANVTGPWRSSAFSPTVIDSSIFYDDFGGTVRIRKAGLWVTL